MEALETWMKRANLSKDDVARRSGHDVHHILKVFDPDGPEPTLRIYLSLLEVAGARFAGVDASTVPAVLKWIDDRRQGANLDITTLATLAGMKRSHLSRICSGKQGIGLETFDRLVKALRAEEDMRLVARGPEHRADPEPRSPASQAGLSSVTDSTEARPQNER